jgi:phenylalanyl-tRNA synthetase alpha chain
MDTEALTRGGLARIAGADNTDALEQARVELLGRRAELTLALHGLRDLPPDQRAEQGKVLNIAKRTLETALAERQTALERLDWERTLEQSSLDVTLPGTPYPRGSSHILQEMTREILDVFVGMGYRVFDGPEIETVYYNFDALNVKHSHPTRQETDTFFVTDSLMLRPQTTPVQVRAMESQPPPIYGAVTGRVYRRDTPDATHSPMFTQIDGFAVDRGLTLANLKGTMLTFARAIFGEEREVRLRPHFFPFTEPSLETDVSCFACARDGSACKLCKGTGWIEILGAGMIDPTVFARVGYDPEELSGFAFGIGLERVATLRHAIPDLRLLFDNDLRLLEQFS